MTIRFSKIDETNRGDHFHLLDVDACLYLYEYTSQTGYAFSATNQLISNLKKKPTSGQGQLYYKKQAMARCAAALREALNPDWLAVATFVPVPSSKAVGHADHDHRMEEVARQIRHGVDVRDLVIQRESTLAAHEAQEGERVTVNELLGLYEVDERLTNPPPRAIGILDDVLTAGTHFRAMSIVLGQRFPGVPTTGLFIARRVFPPAALDFAGVIVDL